MYCLQYSDPFTGDMFMATKNLPYYSTENALNNLFLDYQHCLLTVDCNTVTIYKTSRDVAKAWKLGGCMRLFT